MNGRYVVGHFSIIVGIAVEGIVAVDAVSDVINDRKYKVRVSRDGNESELASWSGNGDPMADSTECRSVVSGWLESDDMEYVGGEPLNSWREV